MAFKPTQPKPSVPNSPEKILLDLPRRKIPGVLLHQGEILQRYAAEATQEQDVALQLPTGSGKTLVGLLIAEWRRRKFGERVVYLCPTRQLVNQVAEQANEQYGLTVESFTGPITGYAASAKAAYQSADRVAITNYSSLFNTNPYFSNPQLIILDDAHAADNYIPQLWSVKIERANEEHKTLHTALANLLRPIIGETNFSRLVGDWSGPNDASWVDKLASPKLHQISNDVISILDTNVGNTKLKYGWSMIRDHLNGCQLYLSSNVILIRPLIVPTWTHQPFVSAKQRIFVSATLGEGGDLERITGRKSIRRLQVPEGWDRQGIGRRFFMFPGMSLDEPLSKGLRHALMKTAGRSVVLVPSDSAQEDVKEEIEEKLKFKTFDATDIEESKKPFTSTQKAVAIIANRYDGIDFPGDDCRLLFIEGLPAAMNAQERFIMASMGARIIYNDRIQTRVVQAIGRCTRALQDYSAVVVSGDELSDYLADKERQRYLHPELQAEIEFGIEQSQEQSPKGFLENFAAFLENKTAWEQANQEIIAKRETAEQSQFPAREELKSAVAYEIEFQTSLWSGDYHRAVEYADRVLGALQHPDLKGYRALWHYLAGSAAWLGYKAGEPLFEQKSILQFEAAKKAAPSISWLVPLAKASRKHDTKEVASEIANKQIENLELALENLGKSQDHKFSQRERDILNGLNSADTFENAHKLLGELLGFDAGKIETDGSPDPWWICGNVCIVFEDHVDGKPENPVGAEKARQAASHPAWIMANIAFPKDGEIISVLVTSRNTATEGAKPHLQKIFAWPRDEFIAWAKKAVGAVRTLRATFSGVGDLDWRAKALAEFERRGLDVHSIVSTIKNRPASAVLRGIK